MSDRHDPTERPERSRGATTEGLPIVDPGRLRAASRERSGPVVGVLLAAGTSSRFGTANKLLATVGRNDGGEPIVRRAAATLSASTVDRTVAVLGHEAERVRRALDGLDVAIVENDAYERGQSTSVRAGVRAARERDAEAVVIALGDMPSVGVTTIDALVGAYHAGAGDALAAAHEGQRGNPVLFDRPYFDALCAVSGDTGGRGILLESERAALVETDDPGVLRDVDTEADLDERRE